MKARTIGFILLIIVLMVNSQNKLFNTIYIGIKLYGTCGVFVI